MPLTNLVNRTYFFKLYACRGMFQRRVGGDLDGQCVGLNFGNLVRLASIDRTMRYVLLPITLDVELFIRVRLVREATEREGEDGHSVVSDYLTSLGHDDRRRRMGEINGFLKDAYSGDLVQKCALPGTMLLWVYLEMAFLGAFIDPWLFCAKRWEGRLMADGHYQLCQSKLIRNTCAHSSNAINGFARAGGGIGSNADVMQAIVRTGISRRVRTAKMGNPRLQQIATLLFFHN